MRLLFALAFLFLVSCGNNAPEERKDGYSEKAKNNEDSLFQDVMDQHDQAMAKMGKLAGYRKQFDARIDSLKKVKSPAHEATGKKYAEISTELKQAEDHMNNWMQQFSIDSAQDDTKRRLEYLASEKSKVTQVKEEILAALVKADSALKH